MVDPKNRGSIPLDRATPQLLPNLTRSFTVSTHFFRVRLRMNVVAVWRAEVRAVDAGDTGESVCGKVVIARETINFCSKVFQRKKPPVLACP
jgi:hypothetical protein